MSQENEKAAEAEAKKKADAAAKRKATIEAKKKAAEQGSGAVETGSDGSQEQTVEPQAEQELIKVAFANNSQSGVEIVLDGGDVVVIAGHAKDVTIETTKDKLVTIQENLASKPWIEVHVVEDEEEAE